MVSSTRKDPTPIDRFDTSANVTFFFFFFNGTSAWMLIDLVCKISASSA
jgi:hypothetical protein